MNNNSLKFVNYPNNLKNTFLDGLIKDFYNKKTLGAHTFCRKSIGIIEKMISDYEYQNEKPIPVAFADCISFIEDYIYKRTRISIPLKNALKRLRNEITHIDWNTPGDDIKKSLLHVLDDFKKVRLEYARNAVIKNSAKKIVDGDTILVYGFSTNVIGAISAALKNGKKFKVIVVDSRPLFEGREMVENILKLNLDIFYILIGSLGNVIQKVTKVFLGAHGIYSNGAALSRCGTHLIAMQASERNIPVIFCVESCKFDDNVHADSSFSNIYLEINRLPSIIPGLKFKINNELSTNFHSVAYDITPPNYISMLITEIGEFPWTSVPIVIREYSKFSMV